VRTEHIYKCILHYDDTNTQLQGSTLNFNGIDVEEILHMGNVIVSTLSLLDDVDVCSRSPLKLSRRSLSHYMSVKGKPKDNEKPVCTKEMTRAAC
jgi:hypothetical protein